MAFRRDLPNMPEGLRNSYQYWGRGSMSLYSETVKQIESYRSGYRWKGNIRSASSVIFPRSLAYPGNYFIVKKAFWCYAPRNLYRSYVVYLKASQQPLQRHLNHHYECCSSRRDPEGTGFIDPRGIARELLRRGAGADKYRGDRIGISASTNPESPAVID